MANLADLIEGYILDELRRAQDNYVELRRGDIADEIECAPSQISYVLNTRFTPARGFVVQSRRGLRGFIRVVRAPAHAMSFEDVVAEIDQDTSFAAMHNLVQHLAKHNLITAREAALVMTVVSAAFATMDDDTRVHLLRTIFATLDHLNAPDDADEPLPPQLAARAPRP